MHPLHKLGNANTMANYHDHYQTIIKIGTVNGAAGNAYLQHPVSLLKLSASLWSTEQEPCTTKSMRHGLNAQLA